MDLTDFFSTDDVVWFHLEHPKTYEPMYAGPDETLPLRIALRGPSDPSVEEVEKKISNDIFMKAQRTRAGKSSLTADDNERYNRMRFAIRIADWENLMLSGAPIACTPDNKKTVFEDKQKFGWLREQIERFMLDDTAFLAGTPMN